jgi:hypothetical protein
MKSQHKLTRKMIEVGFISIMLTVFSLGAVSTPFIQTASAQTKKQTIKQVAKWDKKYGYLITNITNEFNTAGNDTNNSTALVADCTKIFDTAVKAQSKPAIPYKAAEKPWAAALNSYVNGAEQCQLGVNAGNVSEINQATADFTQGTASLDKATAAIQKL